MAFPAVVIDGVTAVARRESIEPAALFTVVEVEGAGANFVEPAQPSYPRFLFERHKFYDNLKALAPSLLSQALDQGLANKGWQRQTQYLDQGSSAGRVALFKRACALHPEAAYRSCSWGIGQIMGSNYGALRFGSALEMFKFMQSGGLTAQIDCMVRFMKSKGLIAKINAHDWTGFAKAYNGAGYAQNQYDTKMRLAYPGWKARLDPAQPEITTSPEIESIADLPALRTEPVPQTMAHSDIANASILSGGGGAMLLLNTIWNQITMIPDSMMQLIGRLAVKPTFWISVAIVGAGVWIYYSRYKKMRDAEA